MPARPIRWVRPHATWKALGQQASWEFVSEREMLRIGSEDAMGGLA